MIEAFTAKIDEKVQSLTEKKDFYVPKKKNIRVPKPNSGLFCWMCQDELQSDHNKAHSRHALETFVKNYVQPSPFFWEWSLKTDRYTGICSACVNWKRRCMSGKLKRFRPNTNRNNVIHVKVIKFTKPMMIIDQMIMFCISPGRYQFPDRRCLRRLIDTFKNPNNMLSLVVPDSVMSVVKACTEITLPEIVRRWWDYNNHTQFFKCSITARWIRYIIKMENRKEEWWSFAVKERLKEKQAALEKSASEEIKEEFVQEEEEDGEMDYDDDM